MRERIGAARAVQYTPRYTARTDRHTTVTGDTAIGIAAIGLVATLRFSFHDFGLFRTHSCTK